MFDPSAPHIIILFVVVVLLFGSKRLPGAARSLGQSMHIFKTSVAGLTGEEDGTGAATEAGTPVMASVPSAESAAPHSMTAAAISQAQIHDLQRQIQNLQQAASENSAQPSETF
jgi:sec-independent protein translocase protein TatA